DMSRMLRHGPLRRSPASRTPALVAAPDLVARRYRRARKAGAVLGPTSAPEEVHALRIRCKRLRYALEFVGPLYPKRTPELVRRLVDVQDNLGAYQDAKVAMAHIRGLVDAGFPPGTVFVLGRICERSARQAEALRDGFPP